MSKRTQSWTGPVFWARTLQIGLLCLITIGMLGASGSRFDRLGHEMMCSCGCGQVLLECNHVSCPSSPVMISELRTQLASGAGDTAVLNWFEAKYGATILAAPIRGGFDNVAWIVPIAVFLLATLGTFAVVWMWKRRALRMAGAGFPSGSVLGEFPPASEPNPGDAALRERIRRETEY
jgi:cytochrome c-type biogenesis protein CcmH/NrfF